MEFLSEDPTYLAGGLGLLACAFLIALRLTQQGKYLVWAGAAFALALLVVAVERVWVTDGERIEDAVYGLGRAVAASDADGTLDRLTPDVQYVSGNQVLFSGPVARTMIHGRVSNAKFDFLRVTHLHASAGGQSRRGSAEFRVLCGGSILEAGHQYNFGPAANSNWSLGLRETSPGVWKVSRITPVTLPGGANMLPTGGSTGGRR